MQSTFWVCEVDEYNAHPSVVLREAVRQNDAAKVRSLLQAAAGATSDIQVHTHPFDPPLLEAIWGGHRDAMQVLLDEVKDAIHGRDVAFGGTALHWAAAAGQEDVLDKLLQRAGDANVCSWGGQAPLHAAASWGHRACAELLLQRSADVNAADELGATPLHEAASWGHQPVIEVLLQAHADPNVEDIEQETPLLLASRRGHPGIVEVLLEKGAAVDAANKRGVTSLMNAAFFGHGPVVQMLLARGANLKAADSMRRRTALHWAALNDCRQAMEALLRALRGDRQQFLGMADAQGHTALELAREAGAEDVWALLGESVH